MICVLTVILLPMVHSLPITTNETEITTQNNVSNNISKIETTTKLTIARSDEEAIVPKTNISRSDYIKGIVPPELAIAFVRTNGTTFGDTFANPFGRKLDLPNLKSLEEDLSEHPEFKGYNQDSLSEFPVLLKEFYRAKKLEKLTQEENKQIVQYPQFHPPSEQIIHEVPQTHPDVIYKDANNDFPVTTNTGYDKFKPSMGENDFDTFKPIKSPQFFEDTNKKEVVEYPNPESKEEIIQKHIYVHIPPADSSEAESEQLTTYQPPVVKKEKHYKIIFIKAPTIKAVATPPPALVQKQEKTLIYVLVKRPDVPRIFGAQASEPKLPTKPEVYYIRYGPNKGNLSPQNPAPENILDSGYSHNERKDNLDDVEEKLDDVTV